MMDPQEFFRTLWGDPPPGVINIWRLPDRTSSWHRDLGAINAFLQQFAHEEVYTGVSLADPQKGRFTTKNRIEEVAAGAIAGVWADIDVFHPVHTKAERLPANREEAQEVMDQLPYEPTLIVDSGHGLQYWWLLESPWVFKDEAEWGEARRMVQWWHQMILKVFQERGWTTDSVYDLSRILRIPGTFNNKVKDDPKPVTAVKTGGPRYTVEDFSKLVPEDFVAKLPAPEQKRGRRGRASYEASTTSSGLILDPEAEPGAVRLAALLKANPKFQQSWDQNRRDMKDPSPSGYNMSMADIAIRAGWPEQEVVNLLICWRRIHGHDLKLRERYYDLTLDRAKEPLEKEKLLQDLERHPDVSSEPGFDNDQGEHTSEGQEPVLQTLSGLLDGVTLRRLERYQGDPTIFVLTTDKGIARTKNVNDILDIGRFRSLIATVTLQVIDVNPLKKQWHAFSRMLLSICEDHQVGDVADLDDEFQGYLDQYLIQKGISPNPSDARAVQAPFLEDAYIHVHADDLRIWLIYHRQLTFDRSEVSAFLHRSGWEYMRPNVYIGERRTTYRCWRKREEEEEEEEIDV